MKKKKGFLGLGSNNKKSKKGDNTITVAAVATFLGGMALDIVVGAATDYGRDKVKCKIENYMDRDRDLEE